MSVVIYFTKMINKPWVFVFVMLGLTGISFNSVGSSLGVENGHFIIAPVNELQSTQDPLSARSMTVELSTKENVGVVEQPTLVVLISFKDQKISTQLNEWENRIFKDEYSVTSYFEKNSVGAFKVVPATQTGVIEVELNTEHPDFGSDYSKSTTLANQALKEVAKAIDLTQFDTNQNKTIEVRELAFVFVGAGFEKSFGGKNAPHPNIWGHQSSSTLLFSDYRVKGYVLFGEKHGGYQASIGIICHELGHLYFNLPDLYDRDGSSVGAGNWGVMSYGTWGSSGAQMGDRPVNMLAWSRQKAGFIALSEPEESKVISVDSPVKITTEDPLEYFIVEYRKQEGFDSSLSGSGMLITHIDENIRSYNDDEYHKLIDIEEADGNESLDSRSNYGSSSHLFATNHSQWSFDQNTTPNSDSYTNGASSVSVMFSKVDEEADSVAITYFDSSPALDSNIQLGNVNMVWLLILLLMLFYVRTKPSALVPCKAKSSQD